MYAWRRHGAAKGGGQLSSCTRRMDDGRHARALRVVTSHAFVASISALAAALCHPRGCARILQRCRLWARSLVTAEIALKRCISRCIGPWKIAAQLIELRWRLQTDKATERVQAQAQAAAFAKLLEQLPSTSQTWAARLRRKSGKWAGRGIVIVAGGELYGTLANTLIDTLRCSGCELPIEVFYLGRTEECDSLTTMAAREGVVVRDLLSGQPTLLETAGFGYAAKPLALVASSFAEVLLLDADNAVLSDPTRLFEASAYLSAGALFWSDMYR